jgi:hypothetical protein
VSVLFPAGFEVSSQKETVDYGAARLGFEASSEHGGKLELAWDYRTTADTVLAAQAKRWGAGVEAGHQLLEYSVVNGPASGGSSSDAPSWTGIAVTLGVLALGVGVAFGLDRARNAKRWFRRRRFSSKFDTEQGEVPHQPIRVRSVEEARSRTSARRCACGGPLTPGAAEALRLGDEERLAVRGTCGRCGKQRSLYFQVTSAE